MNKNKHLPLIMAAGFAVSLVSALPAFAQTQGNMPNGRGGRFGEHGSAMAPGIVGTVTAVGNSTLTVTSRMWGRATSTAATATGTVYTVNTASAQIFKNGATSTIASIATGDTVVVQGTVSGTEVTATVIRDGMNGVMGTAGKRDFGKGVASGTPPTSPIQGNGQPVIGGAVASVSGTTLTVTNASNVTYTIDASGAKIVKNGTTTALTNVVAGDNVIVQGTVNGTSVTASSVIDQGSDGHGGSATTSKSSSEGSSRGSFGFFGSIGNFFKHLFGF